MHVFGLETSVHVDEILLSLCAATCNLQCRNLSQVVIIDVAKRPLATP